MVASADQNTVYRQSGPRLQPWLRPTSRPRPHHRHRSRRWRPVLLAVFSIALAAQPAGPVQAQETLGLALAGGGALGFAHLGVILVLEEVGLDPAYIAGTSIGSIVGALYAAGYSGEELLAIVESADWNALLFDTPLRRSLAIDAREATRRYRFEVRFDEWEPVAPLGLSAGQEVIEYLDFLLSDYAGTTDFTTLPRSIGIVATDLVNGEEVVFTSGDLKSAVRASMSVPGVFTPLEYGGRFLIDGGWTNNMPVDVVRDLGARDVIAVNLFDPRGEMDELQEIGAVVEQAAFLLIQDQVEDNLRRADLVITPDLRGYNSTDFDRAMDLVQLGREAAEAKRSELIALRDRLQVDGIAPRPETTPRGNQADGLTPRRYAIRSVTEIVPETRVPPSDLSELGTQLAGRSLTVAEIRDEVYPLYDTGNYEYITYDLVALDETDSSYDLVIYAVPQKRSDAQLNLGFGTRIQLDGALNSRSLLNANYVSRLGPGSGRFETDVWVSEVAQTRIGVSTAIVGPVRVGINGYLLAPPLITYDKRTVESIYLQRRSGGELGAEFPLLRRATISLTSFAERLALERVQGSETIEEFTTSRFGVSARLRYDTLDRAFFPTRGGERSVAYRWRFDREDRSYNGRLDYSGRQFIPLGERLNLQLHIEGGTDFDSQLPEYEQYHIGGAELLEGYYYQEISGDHVLTGGADLRITLFSLPLGVGESVYLRIGGNGGRVWDDAFDAPRSAETVAGGRVGLAFNTVVGELNFGYSLNRDLRSIVYIVLGPAYSAEGNGYQW